MSLQIFNLTKYWGKRSDCLSQTNSQMKSRIFYRTKSWRTWSDFHSEFSDKNIRPCALGIIWAIVVTRSELGCVVCSSFMFWLFQFISLSWEWVSYRTNLISGVATHVRSRAENHALFHGVIWRDRTFGSNITHAKVIIVIEMCSLYV